MKIHHMNFAQGTLNIVTFEISQHSFFSFQGNKKIILHRTFIGCQLFQNEFMVFF